jgi:hypothetical protein
MKTLLFLFIFTCSISFYFFASKSQDDTKKNKHINLTCINQYKDEIINKIPNVFAFFEDLRKRLDTLKIDYTKRKFINNQTEKQYYLPEEEIMSEKEINMLFKDWFEDRRMIWIRIYFAPKGFTSFLKYKEDEKHNDCKFIVIGEHIYYHTFNNLSFRVNAMEHSCNKSSNFYIIYIDKVLKDGDSVNLWMIIECEKELEK